jgi:hypothetical protein
MVSSPPTSVP